jgi:hypothetical protein
MLNDHEVTGKTFEQVQYEAARSCVMLLYDICQGKNVLKYFTTQLIFILVEGDFE